MHKIVNTLWLLLAVLSGSFNIIIANPIDGTIIAGQVEFNLSNHYLEIFQHTETAIIDWPQFDIQTYEHTHFNQPNVNSVAINRIYSQEFSKIEGTLTANGRVILINQNGLLFGPNSRVDVHGLIATTANFNKDDLLTATMQDQDWLFTQSGKPNAKIINLGEITASGGLIGIVAPNVINSGKIIAKTGKVALHAAELFTVDLYGDQLLEFAVSNELQAKLLLNTGNIIADQGEILLSTTAGTDFINSFIIQYGHLQAKSAPGATGEIVIFAEGANAVKDNIITNKKHKTGGSKVVIQGSIDLSGTQMGSQGGRLAVFGDHIDLLDGTIINASGHSMTLDSGKQSTHLVGGEIFIGGGHLGKGDMPRANNLYVASGAVILNDAIFNGDAGNTILWSDYSTIFYGMIFGRAFGGKNCDTTTGDPLPGGNFGNGGFVEVSGKFSLDPTGLVTLTASNGITGTYLLDPNNIFIYGKEGTTADLDKVDPGFASSTINDANSINLKDSLGMWLDSSQTNQILLNFQQKTFISANASKGTDTITVNSISDLPLAATIKIGVTDDNQVVAGDNSQDVYTILTRASSTQQVTVSPTVTKTYLNGAKVALGFVRMVKDLSGKEHHATQSNVANMPLLLTKTFRNSQTTLYFQGNSTTTAPKNGYYLNIPIELMSNQTDFSYFLVYKKDSGSSELGENLFSFGMDDGASFIGLSIKKQVSATGTTTPPAYITKTSDGSSTNYYFDSDLTDNNVHIFEVLWSKDVGEIYLDGVLQQSSPLSGSANNLITPADLINYCHFLGKSINSADDNYLSGLLPEVIVYNTNIGSIGRQIIEQYLDNKWNNTDTSWSTAQSTEPTIYLGSYLKKMSQTANVELIASENIIIDLQGQTIELQSSLTLTANNKIIVLSPGTINVNGHEVHLTEYYSSAVEPNYSLDLSLLTLNLVSGITISSPNHIIIGAMNIDATNFANIISTGNYKNIIIPESIELQNSVLMSLTFELQGAYPGTIINNNENSKIILNFIIDPDSTTQDVSIVYGDNIPDLNAINVVLTDASGAYPYYDGKPIVTTNYVPGSDVGSYYLQLAKGNVTVDPLSTHFYKINDPSIINNYIWVENRILTITPTADQHKFYGESDPIFTFAVSGWNKDDANTYSVSGFLNRISGSSAGNYNFDLKGLYVNSSNYTLSLSNPAPQFTIFPLPLMLNISGKVAKIYDGNYSVPTNLGINVNLTGVVSGNAITVTASAVAGHSRYGNQHVGDYKPTTLRYTFTASTGTSLTNYSIQGSVLSSSMDLTYNIGIIDPLEINVRSLVLITKEYDDSNIKSINASAITLNGLLVSDSNVSITPTPIIAVFDDKNVGSNKTVKLMNLSLTGTGHSNYLLQYTDPATKTIEMIGSITAKTVTVALQGTISKTYDGNDQARLTDQNYAALTGVIGNDQVFLVKIYDGTYNDGTHNRIVPGTGRVSVSGLYLTGKDAINYTLASRNISLSNNPSIGNYVAILPKPLTISFTNLTKTKEYDGNVAINLDVSLLGVIGTETVNLSTTYITANFADPYVGNNKIISLPNISSLRLIGTNSANYILAALPSSDFANITPKNIDITLNNGISKIYDGNNIINLTKSNYTINPSPFAQDRITVITPNIGIFTDPNVGTNKELSAIGAKLLGSLAKNYNLLNSNIINNTGKIIPKNITRIVVDAKTKTYGTTDPILTYRGGVGIVEPDEIKLFRAPGENVGSYLIDVFNGALSNYCFSSTPSTLNITKADLMITAKNYIIASTGTLPATYEYTVTGLANGDLLSSLGSNFSATCVLTIGLDDTYTVGKHTIEFPLGSGSNPTNPRSTANYDISYTEGSLVIY